MGFMDNFTSDSPVTVKQPDYYAMVKQAAKMELVENALNAEVPNPYIKAMITGEPPKEDRLLENFIPRTNLESIADFTPYEERESEETEHDSDSGSEDDKQPV